MLCTAGHLGSPASTLKTADRGYNLIRFIRNKSLGYFHPKSSRPDENVLLAPSRNVLLTESGRTAGWKRDKWLYRHGTTIRLKVLSEAKKGLITQKQAANQLEITERPCGAW